MKLNTEMTKLLSDFIVKRTKEREEMFRLIDDHFLDKEINIFKGFLEIEQHLSSEEEDSESLAMGEEEV